MRSWAATPVRTIATTCSTRCSAPVVTAAPVHNELDALASEQLAAREWFEETEYPGVGTHQYPGLLFKMANTPNRVRTPPPKLGEHSREIYRDLLGYSAAEYEALEARRLVGEELRARGRPVAFGLTPPIRPGHVRRRSGRCCVRRVVR